MMKEIELKSEDVQEILSRPPHILIRLGISIIGVIIAIIFIGSFFFHYPDIIQTEVVVTTENPPLWIVARTTGRMKNIFVKDKQVVRKGELIAVMENSANIDDVLKIRGLLTNGNLSDSVVKSACFPIEMALGDIQPNYSAFTKALTDYRNFILIDDYGHKITAVKKQTIEYKGYIDHLQKQVEISKRVVDISSKDQLREEVLYKKGVSSTSNFEESTKKHLSYKQSVEQLLTSLSMAKIESIKLENSIIDFSNEQHLQIEQLRTKLYTAYNDLLVSIKMWELNYLLYTPSAGMLSYNNIWKENQNITTGDKVFSVVSFSPGMIIGRVKIPVNGSGKVREGQRVNIQLSNYPYMEYGYLTGKIRSISLLSNENLYSAVIEVPQNLVTSYNRKIVLRGELNGKAEIVTDNLTLAQRILYPLRYTFDKGFSKR